MPVKSFKTHFGRLKTINCGVAGIKKSGAPILRFVCAVFLLLFADFPAFAEQLPVKVYTSADGLGSSAVIRVMRDSRSFLWFATRDGLSRFDGKRFTNYSLSDGDSAAQTIFNIIESSDGNYWLTTNKGLFLIKRTDSTEPVVDSSLSNSSSDNRLPLAAEKVVDAGFSAFLADSEGRLWAGGSDGLYLFEEKNGEIFQRKFRLNDSSPKADNNVRTIYEAPDKSFWLGCNTGVYHRRPNGSIIYYPIRQTSTYDQTFDIEPDDSGRIWIAHTRGIFLINPAGENFDQANFATREFAEKAVDVGGRTFSIPETAPETLVWLHFSGSSSDEDRKYRNDSTVNSIFKNASGEFWFAANGFLFREKNGAIERLTDSAVLPSVIGNITDDANGNLWVGTASGAFKLTRQGLTSFGAADGFVDTEIFSVYQNAAGELFFVSRNWFINRLNESRLESERLRLPDGATRLWTSQAAFLNENDWWAMTTEGLYKFDRENLQKPAAIYKKADNLKSDSIYCAFKDSKGNIWFSTRGGDIEQNGLSRFEKASGKFHLFSETESYPTGEAVSAFAETANGDLWFGFYKGGLARFRNNRFTVFSGVEGLPKGGVFGLKTDARNRLWIASSEGGAAMIENPESNDLKFVRFTTAEGLSSDNARCLTEDLAGNIYVGTVRGVDRITPETKRIRHFSVADGLAADFVKTAFRDRDGNLWFGTANGLSRLVPVKDKEPPPPEIFINELNIAGTRYRISEFGQTEIDDIEVDADKNNLKIDFFSVGDAESIKYQYKLEGAVDSGWSAPSAQRTVNFANLAPGSYKFLARAINRFNLQSEKPVAISFSIRPPFYRRWEFLAAIFIVFSAGVFALERYRAKKRKELEATFGELKISENRFRRMIEQSPLGIVIFTPDKRIKAVNKTYLDFWQITWEQIRDFDFFSDEQLIAGGVIEKLNRAFAGKVTSLPLLPYDAKANNGGVEVDPNTPTRWIQAFAYPVKNQAGELREVVMVMEDVSDRITAAENLERAKNERFAELEQVRRRIATDLHDDIGSSLTQIAVLSEVAKRQFQPPQRNGDSPLERITSVSNELVEAMSDIVWAINPNKDNLHDLVQRIRRFVHDVFTAKNIRFVFQVPPFEDDLQIGANLRREAFVICKEAVNNIVKHSGCQTANIEIRLEKDFLFMQISDDGCGFDVDKAFDENLLIEKGGNGLLNLRRRAEDSGGTCEIVSGIGEGTTVLIKIPLHRAAQISGTNGSGKK